MIWSITKFIKSYTRDGSDTPRTGNVLKAVLRPFIRFFAVSFGCEGYTNMNISFFLKKNVFLIGLDYYVDPICWRVSSRHTLVELSRHWHTMVQYSRLHYSKETCSFCRVQSWGMQVTRGVCSGDFGRTGRRRRGVQLY